MVSGGCLDSVVTFYNTTTNTNSMEFSGGTGATGDYLSIADDDDFSFIDIPFSVAFWVKLDAVNSAGFISKSSSVVTSSTSLGEYRIFMAGGQFYIDIANGNMYDSSSHRRIKFNNPSTTNWQHVVITSDGTDDSNLGGHVNLYVKGNKLSNVFTSGTGDGMSNLSGNFKIGVANDIAPRYLNGNMLQFMMWRNAELSQNEVTYLYANGANHRDPTQNIGDYTSSSNLLLWLPLQSNVNDSSGNGHNMTNNNNVSTEANVPF